MINPYADCANGTWLRGNLHTHSTRSDGKLDIQAVLDGYAERGYGFLMISDHDIFTTPDDYAGWNTHDLVMLPGNEVSANGPHLLQIGGTAKVEPDNDRQKVIDQVGAQGGLAVLAHPNWHATFNHYTYERLSELNGYVGIEIFNACIDRIGMKGSGTALEKWDRLLSEAKPRKVWGFAHDDMHKPETMGTGWLDACVHERSVKGVLDALQRGRFFASTGVKIKRVAVEADGEVLIETADAERIVCYREEYSRVAVADANTLRVRPPEGARFLRFDCYGRGEARAWSQPIFFDEVS